MSNETEQIFLPDQRPVLQRPSNGAPTINTINLENVDDFSKVCRVCATITDLVMPIFSGEGVRVNLADKIKRHLPITVCAQDELPLVVCYQCVSTLLATHELVACSRQADAALRTALQASQERQARQQQSRVKQELEAKTEEPGEPDVIFNDIVKRVLLNYFHTMNMDLHEDCQFACQKCPWRGNSPGGLGEHLKEHRVEAAAVDSFIRQCITFEQGLDSDDSEAGREEPPPLPTHCCPFCDSVFSAPARLGLHLGEHVEIGADSAVECCGRMFRERAEFVRHAGARHARAPPPAPACRACGLRAASAAALAAHIRSAHADEAITRHRRPEAERAAPTGDQKYIPSTCPECGKSFSNKYNMAVHARSHRARGPRKFACGRCERSYGSRGALVTHTRLVHGGLLRFACDVCGERFQNRAARAAHAALHTGERPHKCTVEGCGGAFRARNSLLRHMDAHRDVRAYACHCGKAFRRGSHLKSHLKTHAKPPNRQDSDKPTDSTGAT